MVDVGSIHWWPRPHQRPHPPILVGCGGKSVLRRVIAYGDE
jgi:alkanesulfonate monooxygenase SsuD/methylene tetrahydromethanopterin reductase-like flavin-dependent oxidoreductase (luciferase family)